MTAETQVSGDPRARPSSPGAPAPGGITAAASRASGAASARAILAGVTAALLGFAGTVALVREAATAVGADTAAATSFIAALCLGMAVATAWMSASTRMPVVAAYPLAGAALLAATAGQGVTLAQASAAALLSAVLVLLTALLRPLQRAVDRIPRAVASAMLAGVLLPFCIAAVTALQSDAALVAPMLVVFALMRLIRPVLALAVALLVGVAVAMALERIAPGCCTLALPPLIVHRPDLDPEVLLGIGVPLYLVAMASQNLPGMAVLAGDGYRPPLRPILATTGVISAVIAPTAAHGVTLAAVSAAICTGPECHPDPTRRWWAGIGLAGTYLALCLLAVPVLQLLDVLPAALVRTLTGLALLPALAAAMARAAAEPRHVSAATLTFVITASGVGLLGIGAAFWGLMVGLGAWAVAGWMERRRHGTAQT